MKIKHARFLILILIILAALGVLLAPRQAVSGFDNAYPYPPPAIDPWCQEAYLLELPAPVWCPVINEAVSTTAVEPKGAVTPTPAAMKINGRKKGIEK